MNENAKNTEKVEKAEFIHGTTYGAIEETIKSLRNLQFSSGLTRRENRLIGKLIRVLEESLGDGPKPWDD